MTEPASALPERLVELVGALRRHGVRAGTSETVDAAAVVEVLGMDDRERLREGLASALIRRGGQRSVFDAAFDLYFPTTVGLASAVHEQAERPDVQPLREQLASALASDDTAALTHLAAEAVEAFGRYGAAPGGGAGGAWSAKQTLDRVQPQTLIVRALAAARDSREAAEAFTERLGRDEIRRRVRRFRSQVEGEARRRTSEVRGREQIARHAIAPAADQVDFLTANRAQLAELRRTIQPMSRQLATRLATRRRRKNRGSIDIRRTMRRSMSTGGVPVRPAYERRHPGRPEIVLICDMSGSVAGFTNFTMLLVQALRDQFSKVRVFAFVNVVDEVTGLVDDGSADAQGLGGRISEHASITSWHPSSDYGAAFDDFVDRYVDAVGPRTSVLVLGDARTNGFDPGLDAVRTIVRRARHAYWLNPERTAMWATGDSAALDYGDLMTMYECRNTMQLARFVTRLLPT